MTEINSVLVEQCERTHLTGDQASRLEDAGAIYLCDTCSRLYPCSVGEEIIGIEQVYHTSGDWDEKCESQGRDPVEAALEHADNPPASEDTP